MEKSLTLLDVDVVFISVSDYFDGNGWYTLDCVGLKTQVHTMVLAVNVFGEFKAAY